MKSKTQPPSCHGGWGSLQLIHRLAARGDEGKVVFRARERRGPLPQRRMEWVPAAQPRRGLVVLLASLKQEPAPATKVQQQDVREGRAGATVVAPQGLCSAGWKGTSALPRKCRGTRRPCTLAQLLPALSSRRGGMKLLLGAGSVWKSSSTHQPPTRRKGCESEPSPDNGFFPNTSF